METEINALNQKINADRKLCLKYQFLGVIGSGCFGTVYKVINQKTKLCGALKLEVFNKNSERARTSNLVNEISILEKLKGVQGVPKIYCVGKWQFGIFMEMELLASSLHDERCKDFSLAQVKAIGSELIPIMKRIHERGVVHQDLKPQNIMRNTNGNLVIIDFGLASFIQNDFTKQKKRGFVGTPRYASLASHRGVCQTPKDDIQSLLYVLGTLLMKRAPWFQLKAPLAQRLQMIAKYKRITNKDWLKKCGKPFIQTYEHLQDLRTHENPDYGLIVSYFQHHRETLIIKDKTTLQNSKRRKSDASGTIDFPLIQIHYADRNSMKQSLKRFPHLFAGDHKQNSRSCSSFSELAQNGLQIMQLLTEKLLKFNDENNPAHEAQIDEGQATTLDCLQPQINNICKYVNLQFKNPFYV